MQESWIYLKARYHSQLRNIFEEEPFKQINFQHTVYYELYHNKFGTILQQWRIQGPINQVKYFNNLDITVNVTCFDDLFKNNGKGISDSPELMFAGQVVQKGYLSSMFSKKPAKNGFGRLITQTSIYEGSFSNDLKSGFGRLISSDGQVQKGTWEND